MASTETLSVRLSSETRRILAEAAPTHDAAGASALARDILEQWAALEHASKVQASLARTVSYLRTHHDWEDNPADFFPGVKDIDPR